MKFVAAFLLAFNLGFPLLADFNASYPPNPLDTSGGKTSPVFSEASAEASHWLNLIDQAQYEASWGDAGPLFQDVLAADQWAAAMRVMRRPLGNVRTRTVSSQQAVTTLPAGTRGNFVIMKYNTDFAQKNAVVETLILMTVEYGQWRVVGYIFK